MKYTDEIINAYLADELEQDAKNEFLRDLEDDQELKSRVLFLQEMDQMLTEGDWSLTSKDSDRNRSKEYQSFLEAEEGQEYFKTIGNASEAYFSESPKGKQVFGWFGKLSVAASVLILVAFAAFFFLQNPSSNDLYLAYKDSSQLPSLVNRNEKTQLNEFSELFADGENQQALTLLDEYLTKTAGNINPQLYLYKGEILLRMDKPIEAIEAYNQLKNSETLDAPKAHWYLALAYLKMNSTAEAKAQLKKLLNSNSKFNREEATELFDELK